MKGCGCKIGPYDCCTVVCGDCLDVMAEMPDGCVDLVVTSPPYNLGITKGQAWDKPVDYGVHQDNMPEDKYQTWQKNCIAEMLRVTRKHGSIIYNHKPRQREGLVILPHEWVLGFPIHQEIIWDRKSTHNHNPTFLDPVDERLFWLANDTPKIYGGMDNWSILRIPFEVKSDHPAPFPLALPLFFIRSLTKEHDLVSDFFIGRGTTAQAAQMLGRHFFGCDINSEYVAMAEERLAAVQSSFL